MKNILLINLKSNKLSRYKSFMPLALLKISTIEKSNGNKVEFINSGETPKIIPDIIYFSPIFLFNIKNDIGYIKAYSKKFPNSIIKIGGVSATLKYDFFKKTFPKYEITKGLVNEIEIQKPDYDICNMDYSYGFTSRGCVNKCPWCVVPINEGDLKVNPTWENNLKAGHKLFSAMDNNILACDIKHIENVLKRTKERGMQIDFNQAMDCVKFSQNEDFAKLFSKYHGIFRDIRFAWDGKRQDKSVIKTIELLNKYKIKPRGGDNIWYVLYDFKDSFEIVYERIKKLISIKNHAVKLMRYRDIETGLYGNFWQGKGKMLANFVSCITPTGIICNNHLDMLGKNPSEFLKIMEISLAYRKKTKRLLNKDERESICKKTKQMVKL